MCSLCGILGGQSHWIDPSSNPSVFAERTEQRTWHRERQDQTRLINTVLSHYRLSASDWTGHAFIVKSATGKAEIAQNVTQVWAAAETLLGRVCDPLEEGLIADLHSAAAGRGGRR